MLREAAVLQLLVVLSGIIGCVGQLCGEYVRSTGGNCDNSLNHYTITSAADCEAALQSVLSQSGTAYTPLGILISPADYPQGCYYQPDAAASALWRTYKLVYNVGGTDFPGDSCRALSGLLTWECYNLCEYRCSTPAPTPVPNPVVTIVPTAVPTAVPVVVSTATVTLVEEDDPVSNVPTTLVSNAPIPTATPIPDSPVYPMSNYPPVEMTSEDSKMVFFHKSDNISTTSPDVAPAKPNVSEVNTPVSSPTDDEEVDTMLTWAIPAALILLSFSVLVFMEYRRWRISERAADENPYVAPPSTAVTPSNPSTTLTSNPVFLTPNGTF